MDRLDSKKRTSSRLLEIQERDAASVQALLNMKISPEDNLNLDSNNIPIFNANSQLPSICKVKMTDFLKFLYGETVVNEWIYYYGRTRKVLEKTKSKDQCIKTIGEYDPKSPCWLCGLALDINPNDARFKPQCEHILPVLQAILFLRLYSFPYDSTLSQEEKENKKRIYEIEYAWAHAVCNHIKSALVFLKEEPQDTNIVWSADEEQIKRVLSKIFDAVITSQQIKKENWVNQRLEIVLREKINPIVEWIKKEPESGKLTELAAISSCDFVVRQNLGEIDPNTLQGTIKRSKSAGTRSNKKRSLKIMKAGVARQRKLTEYGFSLKKPLSQRDAANAKQNLTRKNKKPEVDELADIFEKMTTKEKKQGGRRRKTMRRKSKKVSK
jgi:hypothetical protein